MLTSEVLDEVAVLMNDVNKLTWTNTVLLPYFKKAYNNLELNLFLNGARQLSEASMILTVPAATVSLTAAGVQPLDLVQVVSLSERTPGSTDNFNTVAEKAWEPENTGASDIIECWAWREEDIKIPAPRTIREVKLRYRKALTSIVGENSLVPILLSKSFLANKTAAYASAFGASNYERAAILSNEANSDLQLLIGSEIRNQQGNGVRRKPYAASRRQRRRGF